MSSAPSPPPLPAGPPAPLPALEEPPPVAPAIEATRILAVGTLLALIVLCLAWELWLAPTGQRTLVWKVVPLLVPLVGLLKRRMYTYRWLSLMLWLYVIEGLVRGSGPGETTLRILAWSEVGLCVLLFVACSWHVRWRLQHRTLES